MYKAFEQPAIVKELNKILESEDWSPRRKDIFFPSLSIRTTVYPRYKHLEYSLYPYPISLSVMWTARKYYVTSTAYYTGFIVKRR